MFDVSGSRVTGMKNHFSGNKLNRTLIFLTKLSFVILVIFYEKFQWMVSLKLVVVLIVQKRDFIQFKWIFCT